MLQITPHHNIIFSISPVDFRKGIDGLCSICRNHLEIEPIEGAVFVFTNKRHISLKILIYDGMGFWLCIRRFSKGKLGWWPQNIEQAKNISSKELQIIFYQGNPLFYKLPKDFSPVTKPP
tara:strand:+ start:454 stop:813 length:360 start_codon:yes stop_codon:yes gene_type:complete